MYGIWKNIQRNIRIAFQIVQKFPGELTSQWQLIFLEPLDIASTLAFSVNEALCFKEKSQIQSCVWNL